MSNTDEFSVCLVCGQPHQELVRPHTAPPSKEVVCGNVRCPLHGIDVGGRQWWRDAWKVRQPVIYVPPTMRQMALALDE